MDFFLLHLPELLAKLYQQVYLVILSTTIAIILGVPLGIYLAKKPKISRIVLACTSIIQTIPSLALLAFLLPILGIGSPPAIVALTLYAVFPILRNSLTAVRSIPVGLNEVAKSLGFGPWRTLYILELPLAFPMILAGVRIAVVVNIATATIAAFIGAGGLGDFINQGLALGNSSFLLLGAIPAALLALFFDSFFGMIETIFEVPIKKERWWNSSLFKKWVLVIFVLLWFSPFFFRYLQGSTSQKYIRVATKNFTEQIILGEMVAQLIENKTPLKVERKFNLGSTYVCHGALIKGDIDLYPEYTGTAYLLVLNEKEKRSAEEIYEFVSQNYRSQFNALWLDRLGFSNTEALAIRADDVYAEKIHTISELSAIAPNLRLGAPSEFLGREDGIPGLQKAYNLYFLEIIEMDPGLMYKALQTKVVDVISAFSTDGRLPIYRTKLLVDDKEFFPSYDACLVVREEVLTRFPQLQAVLELLNGKITTREIQQLNMLVDEEKQIPAVVAHQFLKKKNLL